MKILLLRLTRLFAVLLLLTTFAFSLAGYLGTSHRYFEIASHFKPQYLIASVACLAVLLCLRAWRWGAAALICVLLNAAVVAPWLSFSRPASTYDLRILLSNVNAANTSYSALIDLIATENPDVVVIQEASPEWLKALSAIRDSYPYFQHALNRDGAYIALMSRFRFEENSIDFEIAPFPKIIAKINVNGVSVSLISIHPPPPVDDEFLRERNEQLSAVASIVKQMSPPVVVAGDLNTSVWSPYYLRFVRESNLIAARRGFGILPTWPVHSRWLMIPLDHCLISADVRVRDCRTGREIGSDHLPLIIYLAFSEGHNSSR